MSRRFPQFSSRRPVPVPFGDTSSKGCFNFSDAPPYWISYPNSLQIRKLILEMIHRLPVSETIRPHVDKILVMTLKMLREDNEDNVLICLRIIIDLHKYYRPPFYPQVGL